MFDGLLVLWIALIGADRIDFLAGSGGFVLTPFLVLTPLVLASELVRFVVHRGVFRASIEAVRYLLCISLLLSVVVTSVLLSGDMEMAVKRSGLLLFQVLTTFAVAVVLGGRETAGAILRRGAYLGLLIALVFNAGQLVLWFAGATDLGFTGLVVNPFPHSYAGVLPRLSGQVYDQNRGGLLVLTYLFLLWRFAPPSRWRVAFLALGLFFMAATLSRSVMLAAGGAGAVILLQTRSIAVARTAALGASLAGAVVVAALLVSTSGQEALVEMLEPLSERWSIDEGSASAHLELLAHGAEVATSSIRNLLFGIGFGNAYLAVQEFFPGSKYGNFHSLYVTFLAESGIFALALCLVLFAVPMVRGSRFLPLVLGLAAFNLFYQSHTEPAFWLVLALAWIDPGASGLRSPDAGRQGASSQSMPTSAPLAPVPT